MSAASGLPGSRPLRTPTRTRRVASALLIALFAIVTCVGVSLTASRAAAVFQEIAETGQPGYLRLAVDSETLLTAELAPGESMRWLVEASLEDAPSGDLAVSLAVRDAGPLAASLVASIEACAGEFSLSAAGDGGAGAGAGEPVCTAGSGAGSDDDSGSPEADAATTALAPVSLAELGVSGGGTTDLFPLPALHRGEPRQLLVEFSLPADAAPTGPGAAASTDGAGGADARDAAAPIATLGLGVHAQGDDEVPAGPPAPPTSPPELPVTGADLVPLGVLAAGLIGVGAGLALLRGGRRRGGPAADTLSPGVGGVV